MIPTHANPSFFGWRVMWAAFVVAVFGWGVGFYGPPVFLYTLEKTHGWSIRLISAAVTSHYLLSALLVANMPALYNRFGLPLMTKFSVICLALGTVGWASAQEPWHLFFVTILSGIGWAGTGAIAINTIIAPWFNRRRPMALSMAYNGASVGGVLFSPIWVALITALGFQVATALVGLVMVIVLWGLTIRYFSATPQRLGLPPDGELSDETVRTWAPVAAPLLPGRNLWVNRAFLTYTAGFTLGLFVQVGIIAHLVSLLAPALGEQGAGLAAGFATTCAIAGRLLVGWRLPPQANRRAAAAITYVVQMLGCTALMLSGGDAVPLLLLGVGLFGLGIGNVTSLPPLIAQAEFAEADVSRAIALSTAIAQAAFAFAPAAFGILREWPLPQGATSASHMILFFSIAASIQMMAAVCYLMGRPAQPRQ